MVEAVAMVVMVDKLDVVVTMTMAVVITPRPIQVRQNSRVHVRHTRGMFLTAPTIARLTNKPPL